MKFSIPPLTRGCVLALIGLSVLNLFIRYLQYSDAIGTISNSDEQQDQEKVTFSVIYNPLLTLVPQHFVLNPWTIVTNAFVEQSVSGFLVTLLTLLFAGRYCERIWGSRQLFQFLALQICLSSVVALIFAFVEFAISRDDPDSVFLISRPVYGGIAIQMGYLVAFKQMIPEHALVFLNDMGRIQVQTLPLTTLLFYTVVSIALHKPPMMMLAWSGFLVAWVYLRYFRVSQAHNVIPLTEPSLDSHGSTSTSPDTMLGESTDEHMIMRGDPSDSFAFAEFFFPSPVHDVVALLCDAIYKALVSMGLHPRYSHILDDVDVGVTAAPFSVDPHASVSTNQSGSASKVDTDRRRELALKVLNSKLQTAPATASASTDASTPADLHAANSEAKN